MFRRRGLLGLVPNWAKFDRRIDSHFPMFERLVCANGHDENRQPRFCEIPFASPAGSNA
jgi:hypothetical protein